MNCPICNAGEMDKMGRIGHYACDTAYYLEDGKIFSQGMQCIKRERDNLRALVRELAQRLQCFAPFASGSLSKEILNRPEIKAIMEETP